MTAESRARKLEELRLGLGFQVALELVRRGEEPGGDPRQLAAALVSATNEVRGTVTATATVTDGHR